MLQRRRSHPGFTLVEMLVVIAIIGILAAILVPVVFSALQRAKVARITLEESNIAAAIESYKQKYNDYPPDFSDRSVVLRHLQKAFPRMAQQEYAVITSCFWLYPNARPGANGYDLSFVDRAEALVLWLGGLSDDPRRPFTGLGGPLVLIPDASGTAGNNVMVNRERTEGFFSFDEGRLGLGLYTFPPANPRLVYSSDEALLHGGTGNSWYDFSLDTQRLMLVNDPFPVYAPEGQNEPYAYFDSRTYNKVIYNLAGNPVPNNYTMAAFVDTKGTAVPYKSDQNNPNFLTTDWHPGRAFYFANRDTFQIISAGLDTIYGGVPAPVGDQWTWTLRQFPNGTGYHPGDRDNITNFSDGALSDRLP